MLIRYTFLLMSICIFSSYASSVFGSDWRKVDNAETLAKIYSDTTLRGVNYPHSNIDYNKLNTEWQIDYCSDGTGILTFWDQVYPRTWKIKGQDQVCVTVHAEEKCYFYEEHTRWKNIYRTGVIGKRRAPRVFITNNRSAPWVFIVNNQKPEICP